MAKKISYSTDLGIKDTNKKLEELEKKIRKEYEKAYKDVEGKMKDYLDKFEKKDSIRQEFLEKQFEKYQNKEISFNDYKKAQEEYKQWKIGQIAIGKRWEEMRDTLAEDLTDTYGKARSMIEGYMPEVFALNHNYATFQVETLSKVNTSYTLYDAHTVERLLRDNPKLLPKYKFGKTTYERLRDKNLMWNKENVTSAVLQGILQGESIPKIAERMRNVAYMDYKASIRDARTSITSAQNAGRIEGMHRAEDLGIKMMKQWLATIDDRTRHEHRELDGQRRPVDEPFEVEGYEIMYPADPDAEPEMVYNCRCTLVTVFDGFDKQITDFDIDERLDGMSYDDWKESRDINPDPIDKQERQAEAMKKKYIDDYRRMKKS